MKNVLIIFLCLWAGMSAIAKDQFYWFEVRMSNGSCCRSRVTDEKPDDFLYENGAATRYRILVNKNKFEAGYAALSAQEKQQELTKAKKAMKRANKNMKKVDYASAKVMLVYVNNLRSAMGLPLITEETFLQDIENMCED